MTSSGRGREPGGRCIFIAYRIPMAVRRVLSEGGLAGGVRADVLAPPAPLAP